MATNFDLNEWEDYMENGNTDSKSKPIKASSLAMKCALLHYFRFKRQYICVDECNSGYNEQADILVDTNKAFWEVEIKTSKADLLKEKKKKKHKAFKGEHSYYKAEWGANKFYLCVTEELKEYAEKWIEEMNPKYGLMIYVNRVDRYMNPRWENKIWVVKNAKVIHKYYNESSKITMMKRLSSALANSYATNLSIQRQKELNNE